MYRKSLNTCQALNTSLEIQEIQDLIVLIEAGPRIEATVLNTSRVLKVGSACESTF